MASNVTSRQSKAAAAALVVGLSLTAGLNAVRNLGGHEPLTKTQQFQARSRVKFPTDLTYRQAECPSYRSLGFACWAPVARTIYYAGKPNYGIFLHESCHAWQTDHAASQADKQTLKAILNYRPTERFDWNIGEAARSSRVPPIEAFADGCAQCARGKWEPGIGYGRYLSKSRWRGLCRFIAARA